MSAEVNSVMSNGFLATARTLIMILLTVVNFFLVRTLDGITENIKALQQRTDSLVISDNLKGEVLKNLMEKVERLERQSEASRERVFNIEKQLIKR